MKIGLVFGGKSGEHEVSVRSAASIFQALDKSKYEVTLLGVDKLGNWHKMDQAWLPSGIEMKSLPNGDKSLVIQNEKIDVVFPIVHGTFGEDGCMQGMFELMNVAYVGAGVLGSAVGMDKDVQKRLLLQAGIPVAKFKVINKFEKIKTKFPAYVKPVNMGSSVGISKVRNDKELEKAIKLAFEFDTKVIIEEEIKGRELEVSVLGNDKPTASVPGEVITDDGFYDYKKKYIDENGARLQIPAELRQSQVSKIQQLAVKAFRVLECSGMARVDMFMRPNGQLVINEINTLPGFTSISMYPKLWEASGLSYTKLLDRLIELAVEKRSEKDKLKRSYD